MKARCQHGYFFFNENKNGQISQFMSYSGLSLVAKNDYYTFEDIQNAPDYSLVGLPYLGADPIITFEGEPWEVFEANEFVYDFTTGLIKPINSITIKTKVIQAGNRFLSPGLIQPGSLTAEGKRVRDYTAFWSQERLSWFYSEVAYV